IDENNIKNVKLLDTFKPEDTLKLYQETDLILNLYGNKTPLLDYALSNKLYYAATLYKPILVCPETFMEKMVKKYNIGYSLSLEKEDEKDALFDYIKKLDRKKFILNCDKFMHKVNFENKLFEKLLIDRIEGMRENLE
ncbi:TPA: capsular biosynthesis protein, partial [Streptococcus suis]